MPFSKKIGVEKSRKQRIEYGYTVKTDRRE
jgi:hypothetical protein